ncbi:MAG TPA: hypothetical protein VFQ85_17955 [Mycobacteriales bacterium]|jgi:hypothetical protein|nr:hypothetical protein [Mycobacteriales bacterium]
MSDLDRTIRAAVDAAGAGAVAPPFGTIERRDRARRTRRTVTIAVAGVAAVLLATLAVPALARREAAPPASGGHLRPFADYLKDPDAQRAVGACVRAGTTVSPSPGGRPGTKAPALVLMPFESCLRRHGFRPPDDDGIPEPDQAVCDPRTEPGGPGVFPVATGQTGSRRWWVIAWSGRGGTRCTSWRTDLADQVLHTHADADDDSGPVGQLRAGLHWDTVRHTDAASWIVVWGALPPDVARVHLTTRTAAYDVATVPVAESPDRVYLGAVVQVDGSSVAWQARYYDATGREVGRYP